MNQSQAGAPTYCWFAVRTVYRSCSFEAHRKYSYEERVVLFYEQSFESAIVKAELEGQQYCIGSEFEMLDYASAFEIDAEEIGIGCEVFSLIRNSDLETKDYIESMLETGDECARFAE